MKRNYDIRVKDSIVAPELLHKGGEQSATYKKAKTESGRNLYLVYLFLEGRDLAFVKRATYTLHRTFKNPIQAVDRNVQNQNCLLPLWTWGIFNVKVLIEFINGTSVQVDHYLDYGNQIKNNKNINWIDKS